MSDKKYLVGIDFGTLSGRAIVVDAATGETLGTGVTPYRYGSMERTLDAADGQPLPPEFALQNPDDYIEVLGTAVPKAVEEAGVDPADIVGIGIDATSATVFFTDKDGEPLCNKEEFKNNIHAYVKLWKHHGAQNQADRLVMIAEARRETKYDYRQQGLKHLKDAQTAVANAQTMAIDWYGQGLPTLNAMGQAQVGLATNMLNNLSSKIAFGDNEGTAWLYQQYGGGQYGQAGVITGEKGLLDSKNRANDKSPADIVIVDLASFGAKGESLATQQKKLGRVLQTLMSLGITTVAQLAEADVEDLLPRYLPLTQHRDRPEQRLRQEQMQPSGRSAWQGTFIRRDTA